MSSAIRCVVLLLLSSIYPIKAEAQILFEKTEVHTEKYYSHFEKEVIFPFRNVGDEDLKVSSLYKACGCAQIKTSKKLIKPGESAKVIVTLQANSIFGKYMKEAFVK